MNEATEMAPVLVCSQPPVISENLVDLRKRIDAITEAVKSMPKDREGVAEVKRLRAGLRKDFESLEEQRKAVHRAVMEPYDAANALYKKLVTEPIREADGICKGFVEEFETAQKSRCETELREYFAECCLQHHVPWLRFEQVGLKIDMATANKKSHDKEMDKIRSFVQDVRQTMITIDAMEDAAEIMLEYRNSLDLAKAIANAAQRRKDREKMEQAGAALRAAEDARKRAAQALAQEVPEAAAVTVEPLEKKFRTTFAVTATIPMLRGLKAFLENNKYEYQEVTDNG